jgi:hypothetical protein
MSALPEKTRCHLQTAAILDALDAAERQATDELFAIAARIAARAISKARHRARREHA